MAQHEQFIRQCIALAISAAKKGNEPFGALLVHGGKVIMTAENTVTGDNDFTRHAELNLVVNSQRAFSSDMLQESILYTSTAPCILCTGAIWFAGISKIVYSVSYESFVKLVAPEYKYISCKEIFQRLETAAEIVGPILEKEGLGGFQFWK